MAEAENFDDELFADLYNDDEPSAQAAAPAIAQEPVSASAPAAPAPVEVKNEAADDAADQHYQNGEDSYMHQDDGYDDEDDDDVDFNLGGNMPTASKPEPEEEDMSIATIPPAQQRAPVAATKGPHAKEDG